MARRSSRRSAEALMLILIIATVATAATVTTGGAAQAETSGCSSAGESSLVVIQTSTMEGLAPGVPPVAITGEVLNNAADSTHIAAVEVHITAVTPGRESPAGSCGAGDYRVLHRRMPVGQTLVPGGSTSFAGASIGFSDMPTNQDACQGATVHLVYTANPS
jgi:hypothetical protein